MIKLKTLLKEDAPGFNNRKFGDSLPTLSSVMNNHQSNENESVDEMKKLFTTKNIKKALVIAKKMKGNMTGAVKKIEKLNRGLSDEPDVASALRKANESVNEAGTKSIDGEELLDYLQKRFKMSRKQAIASMKKHNMDVSSIKKESMNEISTGWKKYKVYDISSKLWGEMKYDLRDQFDELVKIGADYGVFQNAQGTAKVLKQIQRLMHKL